MAKLRTKKTKTIPKISKIVSDRSRATFPDSPKPIAPSATFSATVRVPKSLPD